MTMTVERQAERRQRWEELRGQLAALQASGELNAYTDPPEDVELLIDEHDAIEHELASVGHPDFSFMRIEWFVRGINRRTREQFDRRLVLRNGTVPPDAMRQIRRILRQRRPKRAWEIVRYRGYFAEKTQDDTPREGHDIARGRYCCATVTPEYFEDEAGNPLDSLGFMRILTGRDDIVVIGDPASVLRIGPTGMAVPERWTLQKSNDVAHFLEVVRCLAQSDWVRAPTSYAYQRQPDGTEKILHFERPDVLTVNSVLVFIRQLISNDDKLLKLATDAYLCHTSDPSKKIWVTHERDAVKRTLNSPPFLFEVDGRPAREIIDLFFYSFGLIHHAEPQAAKDFKTLVQRHGRERMMMAFNGVTKDVYAHAHRIAHVVSQDFTHWVATGTCVGPERVGIADLMGEVDRR